ncbi:prolyl 4-hydroxylase alpha subunit [Fusarium sp. NRRL 52700]|nr:prolyl 4-hydroxylase alpha subunit [Fusarium sp. NRRL 52700]
MAPVPRNDSITRGLVNRARRLQGWRGNSTLIEQMKAQRYPVNGFFAWHEDYDGRMNIGNRITTFMVYLNDDFTGGGTNFPLIERPADKKWCEIIECEDTEYPGVTFKPIKGSAVFWENMYPNGSFHPDVRHASLPIKSGQKLGLNIFGWDRNWTLPR